jgi:hypothetical protein
LSTSPELAHKALEATPDAMIIIDGLGTIRYTNRQVFALCVARESAEPARDSYLRVASNPIKAEELLILLRALLAA